MDSGRLDSLIEQHVKAIEAKMIAWRRDFHEHPELGMQEFRTSKIVADHLRELGFDEVREQLGGGTGVVGILRGGMPGPTVALRGDMDALPIKEETDLPFASKVTAIRGGVEVPVMHSCGHDVHTAILMAAAEVLARLREKLKGNVMIVFQPCEEGPPPGWIGPSGAELMVQEGVFNDPMPDAMFGLHVHANTKRGTNGMITYHKGVASYCMDRFTITVQGIGAHASMPWEGVDALVIGSQIVSALQTIPSRGVNVNENAVSLSIGTFHSGTQHNVVSDKAEMKGALRFTDASTRAVLEKKVEDIATKIAESAGATATVEWTGWVPQLNNNPELTEQMVPSLIKATGSHDKTILGEPFALDDFSFFSELMPSIFFFLSVAQDDNDPRVIGGHHTPLFWINEDGLLTGLKAMLYLTADYLDKHS